MAATFPYTLYACPCNDTTPLVPGSLHSKRASRQDVTNEEGEEHTFNPHDPRANYALNPLENLLFCDECNIIRCSKCWTEEIIYWYCPNCLFEVPSSGVKSDGNRCARHCYNCPVCTATLSVTALNKPTDNTYLKPGDNASANESYILYCQHCDWSSLDIGVRLNKPTKITEQLNKLRKPKSPAEDGEQSDDKEAAPKDPSGPSTHDETFQKLLAFYKDQLTESPDHPNPFTSTSSPYSSPANLARIMSLYGGLSYNALKKSREKPQPIREARSPSEGLHAFTADSAPPGESEVLSKLRSLGLEHTSSLSQRLSSPPNFSARFHDQLWPVATPLRARRGKRCRSCRQFLARPEPKVGSMRYKIRLIATGFVQRLAVREFSAVAPPLAAVFPVRLDGVSAAETMLAPRTTRQFILTVRNPVFENVRVTLATPAITPGRVGSRVTILCPSFTVGAAGDVWDEALGGAPVGPTHGSAGSVDGGRRAAMASLTGSVDGGDRQPEAGKVWERSRNSTSVVLEVVPGTVPGGTGGRRRGRGEEGGMMRDDDGTQSADQGGGGDADDEDVDVLEIPIYVRAEWEAEPHGDVTGEKKGEKESKELAYWCVLGLGRIASG